MGNFLTKKIVEMRISKNLSLVYRLALTEERADKTVPLYLRLLAGGKRSEISPGIQLHPDHWDKKAHRVKAACKLAYEYNRMLIL